MHATMENGRAVHRLDRDEQKALRKAADTLDLHSRLHPESNQGRLAAKVEIERLLTDDVTDPDGKSE